jgi:hypothetical protein
MKKIYTIVLLICSMRSVHAQSWNITGNSGLTTSDFLGSTGHSDVIFKTSNKERGRIGATGFWRFGNVANNAKIDTSGKLTFGGNGAYQVAGNKYVFQYTGNPNQGLFFNSTNLQYEFMDSSAAPVFSVNANTGNSVFNGTLKIGAYTLPSTDGANGQVLTTNGSGTVSWSNVSGTGGVNTSLSNLTAPTAINAGLLPKTNNSINIGSSAKGWKNIYIDSALYIGGTQFLTGNAGSSNTGVGLYTLFNTTGLSNTATGSYALYSNTSGSYNVATGVTALYFNTTGSYNTANGTYALYSNTTGYYNTANGYSALTYNTTGYENTANGLDALGSNTTGNENTANGYEALYYNTTGDDNTATGLSALYANTTGTYNTANGYDALYFNTAGSDNTANGCAALYNNTTGGGNTANGIYALYYNTTGYQNTADGYEALYYNTTGYQNTANGIYALYDNTTGNYNTADGNDALFDNTTGGHNTALGYFADVPFSRVVNNATVIGYDAVVDASNKVRIGNTSVSSIGGQVGWTSFSDGRYKKNIKEDVEGLKFINLLKPITYTVDINGLNTHYDNLRKHDSTYDKAKAQMQASADAASKIIYNGFIAQDVEKAAQSINYNFSGVDKPQNKDGLYGLRYADFVVPLVKGEQELSKQNDSLTAIVSSLQKQIDELKALVLPSSASSSAVSSPVSRQTIELGGTAALSQNIPNPFSNSTDINYYLPVNNGNVSINFYDVNGTPLKTVLLSCSGKGTITLKAGELPSGVYRYTLVADGKLIGSRQMEKLK